MKEINPSSEQCKSGICRDPALANMIPTPSCLVPVNGMFFWKKFKTRKLHHIQIYFLMLFSCFFSRPGTSYKTDTRVANILVGDVREISFWVGYATVTIYAAIDISCIFLVDTTYVGLLIVTDRETDWDTRDIVHSLIQCVPTLEAVSNSRQLYFRWGTHFSRELHPSVSEKC
jgi:hypothetical protein